MSRHPRHLSAVLVLAIVLATSCQVPHGRERSTPELDAAALTSQALDLVEGRSREGIAQSIELYEAALDLNPAFAPAWSGLADSLALQGLYSHKPPSESLAHALPAARQALQLAVGENHTLDEQELARTHASQGLALYLWLHDFAAAEQSFLTSLELDPTSGQTHHWYAMLLHATGRHEEAIDRIHHATTADPDSRLLMVKTATVLLGASRLDEAMAQLETALERYPDFAMVHRELGNHALLSEDLETAVLHFENAVELNRNDARSICLLAQTQALLGNTEVAEAMLSELEARDDFVAQTSLALIEAGLGRSDRALERLAVAVQAREPGLVYINSRAGFRLLADDPGFRQLVVELGLVASE